MQSLDEASRRIPDLATDGRSYQDTSPPGSNMGQFQRRVCCYCRLDFLGLIGERMNFALQYRSVLPRGLFLPPQSWFYPQDRTIGLVFGASSGRVLWVALPESAKELN